MLTQLISIIDRAGGALEISQLCRKLNLDRSVVEGMLVTLRRMGYIEQDQIKKADYATQSKCASCSLNGCSACQ